MTVATYITFSRLLAGIAMVPLIYFNSYLGYQLALIIFAYVIISDILDGLVARNFNQVTEFGTRLDPLVDKIVIYSVLFGLMQNGAVEPAIIFPMFIRDMFVDGLRSNAVAKGRLLGANIWGKAKFSFQSVSVVLSLWFCLTQREEFHMGANVSLAVALAVSIPGVIVITSSLGGGWNYTRIRNRISSRFF